MQKNIQTTMTTGYQIPGILSIIVAYDGPANMSTVQGWINQYVTNNNIQFAAMPPTANERIRIPSLLADIIVVLGKGFIQFDNSPISFITDTARQANLQVDGWFQIIRMEIC